MLIRLYDLRHTAATLVLTAEVSPKIVSEQLEYASVTFTLETLWHVLPQVQETAAMKVEALLMDEWDVLERFSAECRTIAAGSQII